MTIMIFRFHQQAFGDLIKPSEMIKKRSEKMCQLGLYIFFVKRKISVFLLCLKYPVYILILPNDCAPFRFNY